MIEDDLERLLRTKGWPGRVRAGRCPDEATLAAFVDGGLPESARLRVQGHLADCGPCLEQVAAVLVSRETPPPEVPARLLARARRLAEAPRNGALAPAWRWSMIAAAAGLVLVATTQLWHVRTIFAPQTSTVEVRSAPGRLAAPELLSPREGSVVGREKVEFRWRAVPGAVSYEVELVTAEGDVLWQDRAEAAGARLPGTVPIAPGQELYVWVRAHLVDGTTLKSEPVGFRLEDAP
jgi:anti-sigma factor RsiW